MNGQILCLNAGSSSIKFALFEAGAATKLVRRHFGKVEEIGSDPRLTVKDASGKTVIERRWPEGVSSHESVLEDLLTVVRHELPGTDLIAAGHRVVHGGTRFAEPCLIEDDNLRDLDTLCALAPLHQPHNLAAIRAVAALLPDLPQVACFDTAFHRGNPDLNQRFALPRSLHDQGIRRYGFHGLSYEFIADELHRIDPGLAKKRVIVAHLGNGASLCAMHDGRSIDTTMGFTALDGLMMGTRCGSLDPGVVLHLIRQADMSVQEVERMLYRQSGLLGVSGLSSDVRTLLESDDPRAQEALDLFCMLAAKEISALATVLGGLDAVVFTAGIGENQPRIRQAICNRLEWLGMVLDQTANTTNQTSISAVDGNIAAMVIPTDEERMIANHTCRLLWNPSP